MPETFSLLQLDIYIIANVLGNVDIYLAYLAKSTQKFLENTYDAILRLLVAFPCRRHGFVDDLNSKLKK